MTTPKLDCSCALALVPETSQPTAYEKIGALREERRYES